MERGPDRRNLTAVPDQEIVVAKTKRVHNIAKELGVDSKSIVAKCAAEGVPSITNHMSVVKVGLEQTIHEWFSETGGTAVETADKVDMASARKPLRRKAAAKMKEGSNETVTATAVAEPPTRTKKRAPKKETLGTDGMATRARRRPQAEKAPADEAPAEAEVSVAQTEAPPAAEPKEVVAEQSAIGKLNVPERPTVSGPVGEQLDKPTVAKLKGPKVVRIEMPDTLSPPRPRRPAPSADTNGPAQASPLPNAETRGRDRSRQSPELTGRAPGKRRMLNTRRGRSAESQLTGPTNLSDQDLLELDARLKGAPGFLKKRRSEFRKREAGQQGLAQMPAEVGGKVEISEPIFIKDLSAATGIKASDMIKYLFQKGVMATINSAIDTEAAMEICLEYNIELEVKEHQTAEQQLVAEFEDRQSIDVQPRPPVVTVLGHVDHGKTTLLDRIRHADVAAHEAGGITQHVGAYRVTVEGSDSKDKTVVFLDTPGHEAFTTTRARGASVTDLVVLVVAADDGVMPQTIESINHAKAAGVPILVALNKSDLPQATDQNIQKIYGQLAEHDLNPGEWGGTTDVIKVSAIEGTGITGEKGLLEHLAIQAELLELSADIGGPARGAVIETEMQEGRGPVARVLVQQGKMKVSDFIVIGRSFGRVRDMTDDKGKAIGDAGPSTPLELSGIDMLPDAGDKFYVTDSLKKAEQIATGYREQERMKELGRQTKVTLENFAALATDDVKDLRVVLKTDVQGSIGVLRRSLDKLGNEEVAVRVLHAAVGAVTDSDVLLADASDAVIIGFQVVVPPVVRDTAEHRGIDIRLYRVIYDLTDDIKKALEGMLVPETHEQQIGMAQVREVFRISKIGAVAGCLVAEGAAQRSAKVRVVRDGVVVTDDRDVATVRRIKDDVKEVRAGTECGIRINGFDDVKAGDELIFYNKLEVKRTLD